MTEWRGWRVKQEVEGRLGCGEGGLEGVVEGGLGGVVEVKVADGEREMGGWSGG